MHDAIKIIWLPEGVDLPWLHLEEVILLAWEPFIFTHTSTRTHSETAALDRSSHNSINNVYIQRIKPKQTQHLLKDQHNKTCKSDLFLIESWSRFHALPSSDFTPVRLLYGAIWKCVCGEETWGVCREAGRRQVTSQSLKVPFTLTQQCEFEDVHIHVTVHVIISS